jgi:nitrite reductase/ring-hydroxylating ferredoxin subunit
MESTFVNVAVKSEIEPGKMKAVKVGDKDVLIVNVNGAFYAIGGKCTHHGGNLAKGTLEGKILTCPSHHAQFDVTTGKVVSHPKVPLVHPKANDEVTYEVKVDQENILIKP